MKKLILTILFLTSTVSATTSYQDKDFDEYIFKAKVDIEANEKDAKLLHSLKCYKPILASFTFGEIARSDERGSDSPDVFTPINVKQLSPTSVRLQGYDISYVVNFEMTADGCIAYEAKAAERLSDCTLYVDGKKAKSVDYFEIQNYSTSKPLAINVDGNLTDYKKTASHTTMWFSNECDNMYEITFSNEALKKAKSGEYKTIVGKAEIAFMEEGTQKGILKCTVRN